MIDTHCHLDLEPLASNLPSIIEAANASGVTHFVVPGVHPDGWGQITALATSYEGVYSSFGIHPMHATLVDDRILSILAEKAKSCVAIGEIGLDTNYTVPLERQATAFREQLRVAVDRGLPVLIHCRRAFQQTLVLLREEKAHQVGGIMHAFSGSTEMAKEYIRLGFAISLSGTLTWDNAVRPLRLAKEIPLQHLVLETDAPDMAPQRYRGQPNQPAWLNEQLRFLAVVRETTPEEIAVRTTANALKVLRLPH